MLRGALSNARRIRNDVRYVHNPNTITHDNRKGVHRNVRFIRTTY